MNEYPFISVVMPVYNAERYIRDAVGSVLSQTYRSFELILINDGSKDNSSEICDELAKEDLRICVIHKPQNEGVSMARNTGIEKASGDYIYFMDSDDTIDACLLENAAQSLCKSPAHAVMFGMIEEYFDETGNLKEKFIISYPEKTLKDIKQLRREIIHIENATLYGYSCNKLYKRDYINQYKLTFKNVTINEDFIFNVDFFMAADSLNILNTAPYHYKKRISGSLTAGFLPDYFDLHTLRVRMVRDQYISWDLYTDEVKTLLGNIYCRYIYSAMQRNCDKRSNMRHGDRKTWVKNLFKSDLFNEVVPAAHPKSLTVKLMAKFLQKKNMYCMLISSRIIFTIKTKLPMLFVKAKQKR